MDLNAHLKNALQLPRFPPKFDSKCGVRRNLGIYAWLGFGTLPCAPFTDEFQTDVGERMGVIASGDFE
jgi:hypothetical protein